MSAAQATREADGRLVLRGPLTFATVDELLATVRAAAGVPRLRVDLDAVSTTDSAGVALLVEILRVARRQGGEVTFENPPDQLLAIAGTSGLDAVLLGRSSGGDVLATAAPVSGSGN
ncbi:MAG: STAS domain-containing protein [Ectothiorhodospiraceae bacterium]|nr:STAS domain-containing protein [Ectothiorhodospiraceae bacterium]